MPGRRRTTRGAHAHAPPLLAALPAELQLHVASKIDDLRDAASLCIAFPPLGLAALRGIPRFQDKLMSVALRLVAAPASARALLSERLLRRFANDSDSTPEGCDWLSAQCSAAGCSLRLAVEAESALGKAWYLRDVDKGAAALLRVVSPHGVVVHFEGGEGEERMLRLEDPDGEVVHFEGGEGEERMVRTESPDGAVVHYEGCRSEVRMVRVEFRDGRVMHYEGGRGEERMVRTESPAGTVMHYEGGRDEERMVRVELSDGRVMHYEGGSGEERVVRMELPAGTVHQFVGGSGEER